jgi:PAS domain S-box-containing protein
MNIRWTAGRIAGIYVACGVLWILASDAAMALFISTELITRLGVYKGIAFVGATAAMLYGLIAQAQRAFAISQNRYLDLFNLSQDAIFFLRADGSFAEVNQAALNRYGYTREEMLTLNVRDITPPALKDQLASRLEEALRTPLHLEWEHVHKNGDPIAVDVTTLPVDINGVTHILTTVRDIRDRKAAEEAVRLSEARLRALFHSIPETVYLKGADGIYTDVNAAFEHTMGRPASQIIGHADAELFSAQEAEIIGRADAEAMAGRVFRVEHTRMAGGDPRIIETISAPVYDISGTVIGVCGVSRDVTERRMAERALRESEQRYQAFITQLTEGIYRGELTEPISVALPVDEQVRLLYERFRLAEANNAFAQTYGYSEVREVLGAHLADFHGNGDNPANSAFLEAFVENAYRISNATSSVIDRLGQPRWFLNNMVGLVENGLLVRIWGTQSDITERRLAELVHRRLTAAIEQAAESILITDARGDIIYVNPYFERATGYTREEVTGKNPRILKSGEHSEAYYQNIWACLAAGETWAGRLTNRRKDGTLLAEEATISPVRDASGQVVSYVAVKRDISKELKLEEQLRQSQKMEAIGQLAGGVAHDFNNLLQVISGHTELLLEALPPDSPLHSDLNHVAEAGERASRLVAQLLAFSRRQVMRPEQLDLNEVVASLLKMLSRIIGEHIEVEFLGGQYLGSIQGDRGMVEQVLMNLCVNARDAMPEGGKLTIETENVLVNQEYISSHAYARPGRYVLLSITDNGIGMTREVMEHVFEPFFSTKKLGQGTGLGLATAYGIVKQHHGMIQVYSESGKGSTFKVYFPLSERPADVVGTKVAGVVPGGSETILLAEDDDMVRDLATRILERAGYRVIVARDGEEAIEKFRENRDSIDLLLLDVVMPRLGGHDVLAAARLERPEVKAVFASGYSENAVHTNFVIHEGLHLVQKPFMRETLLRAVREVLDAPPQEGA